MPYACEHPPGLTSHFRLPGGFAERDLSNLIPKQEGPAQTPSKDMKSPKSKGQQTSKERGSATNNKKSPGKRPKQGGSSA